MNTLLIQIYQSTVTKYIKFRKRLDKNISSGRFNRFTRRKQSQLLHKIERLKRRVMQLQTQLKLAAAGAAVTLFLNTSSAQAQATTLGPFQRNYLDNPLPPPLRNLNSPAPRYVDLDGDGDLDLAVGDAYSNYLRYFENIGTQVDPFFLERKAGYPGHPFGSVHLDIPSDRHYWVPAFADIDNDGDLDLLIGTDKYSGVGYADTYFFRNIGSATAPNFQYESGETNPFDVIGHVAFTRYAYPTFIDLDKDGDQDLLLGGYYDASTNNYILSYYENRGTASAPNYVNDPFTSSAIAQSLLSSVNNYYGSLSAPHAFADLDQDGDMDFFFSENGQIHYRRNDNGAFTYESPESNQTGPWVPGSSTGNPFNPINAVIPNNFAFSDLDKDGDLDVSVSYYTDNPSYPLELRPFIYYENKGSGVFEVKTGIESPVDGVDVGDESSASFADIDGDGDLDIVALGNISFTNCPDNCYDYGRTFTTVLRNNAGTFVDVSDVEGNKFEDASVNLNQLIMKLIKVDNDNVPDLVAMFYDNNPPTGGAVQYFKLINGEYVEQTGTQNPFDNIRVLGRIINLDIGDLNGDNLPDLILGVTDSKLKAYKNIGTAANPVFTPESSWETGFTSNHYYGSNPKLIDLDHDGDLDIIVGKYDNIWYYENTGIPTAPMFVEYNEFNAKNPFKDIDIVNTPMPSFYDVDGDGDQDLIFGDGEGQFQYYENTNEAPVTSIASSVLIITGGQPTVLDPILTIVDSDSDDIVNAVITISGYVEGDEELNFDEAIAQANGITGSFNNETGALTLKGRATAAIYQSLLRTVSINFTGTVPGGRKSSAAKANMPADLAQQITFQVRDTDFTLTTISVVTLDINIVSSTSEIIIYNAISPNTGDDKNAFFKIENIETVSPENKVTIYNRWGDIVYEESGYNNTTKKFVGVSDHGKDLPTGTYFYKIETTGKTITGYLSLKR